MSRNTLLSSPHCAQRLAFLPSRHHSRGFGQVEAVHAPDGGQGGQDERQQNPQRRDNVRQRSDHDGERKETW
jgi:hypothetical protein